MCAVDCRGRAQGDRLCGLGVGAGDGDDPRTGGGGDLDRSCSDSGRGCADEHRLALDQPAAGDQRAPGGEAGHGERCGLVPGQVRGLGMQVRRRHGDVLGMRAVRGGAEDLVLGGGEALILAPVQGRRDDDVVPDLAAGGGRGVRAELVDDARAVRSEDRPRGLGGPAVEHHGVEPVQAGALQAHDRPIASGVWTGHVRDAQGCVMRLGSDDYGSHGVLLGGAVVPPRRGVGEVSGGSGRDGGRTVGSCRAGRRRGPVRTSRRCSFETGCSSFSQFGVVRRRARAR